MIKLYTTNCPKCKVLEKKLDELNLTYDKVYDNDVILSVSRQHKILSAPILQVDDDYYKFSDALNYIKDIGNENN